MTRSGPSCSDQAVISELAGRGISVSVAQLERWRRAGLMPRNARRGRGRGCGSTSAAQPEAAEIAAAVARHARQGRDLRLAVIDWFAEAAHAAPGEVPTPEPPMPAVRAAVAWVISSSPEYQLLQRGRAARSEDEVDEFYQAAEDVARPITMAPHFDPDAIRQALASHSDVPAAALRRGPELRSAATQLLAAAGLGFEEVGAELIAQALADSGLGPPQPPTAAVQGLIDRLATPPSAVAALFAEQVITRWDPVQFLAAAPDDYLLRAREAAFMLGLTGGMLIMHALLMPDNPTLKELRDTATATGIAPIAMAAGRHIATTKGFATALIACLHPFSQAVCTVLRDIAARGLFGTTAQAAEQHMAAWRTALREARANGEPSRPSSA